MAWDTLPANLEFISNDGAVTPVINGNYIRWDMAGQTLTAGSSIYLDFTVEITGITPGNLIATTAGTDYRDPYYSPPFGRHPPVFSSVHYYPEGQPIIYPNPFNPASASGGTLKFVNVAPGSLIGIYTISGENVAILNCMSTRAVWDGRNRTGSRVSSGIYYYLITNQNSGQVKRGKIFVIKN